MYVKVSFYLKKGIQADMNKNKDTRSCFKTCNFLTSLTFHLLYKESYLQQSPSNCMGYSGGHSHLPDSTPHTKSGAQESGS